MAREKPSLLCEIVPFTNYPVVALCRVARRPVFSVQVGDILARNGAWDHKYVVMSVDSVTECEFKSMDVGQIFIEPGVLYKVTVRNLGRFYSDNRFKPATQLKDRQIDIRIGLESGEHETSALKLVQPIGNLLAPTVNLSKRFSSAQEIMKQYANPWSYLWTFKGGDVVEVVLKTGQNGPTVPKRKDGRAPASHTKVIAAAAKGYTALEQPPLPPEAILAHFAL